MLGLKHGDDDLFEQRSQQLLAIARRGGRRFPYVLQIGAEREQAAPVFCAECSRSFTFAPGELGFGLLELAQALLPLALEAAGDETVLGIDSAIAAFGTLCLVPGPFSGEPALGERIVAIGFEPAATLLEGELLTVKQAAAVLGTATSTIHRWLNDGFIGGEQLTPGAHWRIRLTEDLRDGFVNEAPKGFLTMYQAMRLLGVSRQTVLQRVKRGELDAIHVMRGKKKGLRIKAIPAHPTLFDVTS